MITTEKQLWQAIKLELKAIGLPVRIENTAATSLPDVELIRRNQTFRLELKIVKSHKFTMPKFQFAFGKELSEIVNENYFWVIAQENNARWAIRYDEVIPFAKSSKQDKVEFDIRNMHKMQIENVGLFLMRYNDV